jgi:hypothetical protein
MNENTETAILAGGCFWPAQQLLRYRDGVIATRAGSGSAAERSAGRAIGQTVRRVRRPPGRRQAAARWHPLPEEASK